MNVNKINKIDAIEYFLEVNQAFAFGTLGDKHEHYKLLQSPLIRLRYITLSKPNKCMVIRFLIKITGYYFLKCDKSHYQMLPTTLFN